MRLYDLEEITKKHWSSPHQWRYHENDIEFGLETKYGMQWFSYIRAPVNIFEIVRSYKKLQDDKK
jgi:hypothetical protein